MEHINESHVTAVKITITGAFTLLSAWLGWFGWLVVAWVGCMAIDYITGSAAAAKAGQWNSKAAREGCWHKLGEVVAVLVTGILDLVLGLVLNNIPALTLPWDYTVLLCPIVTVWYILTELGSITENAGLLGAPLPSFLRRILAALKGAVDEAGVKLTGDEQEPPKEK